MSFASTEPSVRLVHWRRDLALVAIGGALSLLGDEIAVIALMLRASNTEHAVVTVAALLIAAIVPSIVLAPVAGLVVDRLPTKPLVAVTCVVQALLCVLLATVSTPMLVIALVALLSVGQAFVGPAWSAMLPSVVSEERLPGALSTVQSASATAGILGPAMGGLLVGFAGTSFALTVDAVSFVALGAAALLLAAQRRLDTTDVNETMSRQATAGLRVIGRDRVLRSLIIMIAAFVLALGAVNVAEVFLITKALGASATAYGIVGACFASGVLLGAVVSRKAHDDVGLVRWLLIGTTLMTLGMAALGLSSAVTAAAAASFVVGVGNGMLNVYAQQLIIRRTPKAMLGRVFAALQAVVNSAMLSALVVGGVLLGVLDVRVVVLLAAGATGVALALSGPPLLRSVRG